MSRPLSLAALAAAALALTGLAGTPAAAAPAAAPAATARPPASAGHVGVLNFGYDQGWRTDRHLRLLADLTGDGRADIVGFGEDGVYTGVARSDGTFAAPGAPAIANFGYQQGWRTGTHPRWAADITGDGRADLVGVGNAGVYTAVGLGNGGFGQINFALGEFGASSRPVTKFFLTDADGDHRADLIAVGDDHQMRVAYAGTQGGFLPSRLVSTAYDFTDYAYDNFQVRDITGDGRPEVLANSLAGTGSLVYAVQRPDGTFTDPRPAGARYPQRPEAVGSLNRIADVDGDGRVDLVDLDVTLSQPRGTYVSRSRGDGTLGDFAFATGGFHLDQGWRDFRHVRTIADITGDGAADLVGFGEDNVYTQVSNRDGTFSFLRLASPSFGAADGWQIALHPRLLADVTGDGRADVVGFGDAGVYTALADGNGNFVEPAGSPAVVLVPDVEGDLEQAATDTLGAAGLTVATTTRPTRECALIGAVLAQNPVAGTQVAPGSRVLLTIGTPPATGSCV